MAEISTSISKAIEHLEKGDVIGLPTETVYGLAGNAYDENVVLKIFEAKQRPFFDPLIVHSNSIDKIEKFVTAIPDSAMEFCNRTWPGPVTLVLPKKNIIPDLVTSGLETVGVRIPNHTMTLEVLSSLDFPLAAPSANPFGYISPTTAKHVEDQLGEHISFILDGGPTDVGIESTIVDFTGTVPVILRLGGMSVEDIESQIGTVIISHQQGSKPLASGMLESHYSPSHQLIIGNLERLIDKYRTKRRIGVLSWNRQYPVPENHHQIVLSENGDLRDASKRLFSALRELDKRSPDLILAELVPDVGLGKAINDRLVRASTS